MNSPWECPRCHRINAPHMPFCDCKPNPLNPYQTITQSGSISWPPIKDRCLMCNGYHGIGLQCATLTVT